MSITIRTLLLAGAAAAAAAPAFAGHPDLQEASTRRSQPAPARTVSRPSVPVRSTAARQDAPAAADAETAAPMGFAPAGGPGCANCGNGGNGGAPNSPETAGYPAPGYSGSNGPSRRETYSGHNPPTVWDRVKYKYHHYWKPGLQESHWGYPELFSEKPVGYWVYQHARTQVANAEGARMTLYDYDFEQDKDTLTPRGEVQLEKIAMLAGKNFFPIVVANTPGDPALAERRKEKLLQILEASNFPIPPERIVVSRPLTPGTYSYEPETILRTNNDGSIGGRLGTVITTGGVNSASTLLNPSITGNQ